MCNTYTMQQKKAQKQNSPISVLRPVAMGRRTEFGVVLGGEVQAEVAGGVGVKPFLPELSQAATAVDAA